MKTMAVALSALLCGSGVAWAQAPTLYEVPVFRNNVFTKDALFFPTGPSAWLVVDAHTLRSQVLQKNSLSKPQPIGIYAASDSDSSESETHALVKGAVQKDGSVLLVWWQWGHERRPQQFVMSRYQAGSWSHVQTIPGQSVQSELPRIATDGEGNLLALWQQSHEGSASQKSNPAMPLKAWYYSLLTEKGPQPAAFLLAAKKDPLDFALFPDLAHHRVHVIGSTRPVPTDPRPGQKSFARLYHGIWHGAQRPVVRALATTGDNQRPSLFLRVDGSAIMLWEYRKEGTFVAEADAQKNKPPVWRSAMLGAKHSVWGSRRILSVHRDIPTENQFIPTPEGGLFTAWADETNPKAPQLRSWYLHPTGSSSTQQVPLVADSCFLHTVLAKALPTGTILLAFSGSPQDAAQKTKVYTSVWDKGTLAPVQMLANQGEDVQGLSLETTTSGHALLAWTQRTPESEPEAPHQLYIAPVQDQAFSSARQLTELTHERMGKIFLSPATANALRLSWEEYTRNEYQLHVLLYKNGEMTLPRGRGLSAFNSPRTNNPTGWSMYHNAAGNAVFLSTGEPVLSVVCEEERCGADSWQHRKTKSQSKPETGSSLTDGSLLIHWRERTPPDNQGHNVTHQRVLHFSDLAADSLLPY